MYNLYMTFSFRRVLLTMSILSLTHVDACLFPSHSRTKVEQVLDKIYHHIYDSWQRKSITYIFSIGRRKTVKWSQCDTSKPFSSGILVWLKIIFDIGIHFRIQNFIPGFEWSRRWTSTGSSSSSSSSSSTSSSSASYLGLNDLIVEPPHEASLRISLSSA